MSRIYIEQIVERARDIRALEADRLTTRAALLDITLDVALVLATKTHTLLEQAAWSDTKKRLHIRRKLRTDWHAITKGVRAVYVDHPITDHHLRVTLAAYYPQILKDGEALFGALTGDEYFQLQRSPSGPTVARKLIQQVLSRSML